MSDEEVRRREWLLELLDKESGPKIEEDWIFCSLTNKQEWKEE
jgi:hypothetical protein